MAAYGNRFAEDPKDRADKIRKSIAELCKVAEECKALDRLKIIHTHHHATYAGYVFDEKCVFTPYLTEATRAPERIPVLVVRRDGEFAERYLRRDIQHIEDQAKAKA